MDILAKYQNGNADITLYNDGTRIVQFEDELKLDYPLNVDIRVSNACQFGLNPKTGKSMCGYCHESAKIDGEECNYDELMYTLEELPKGVELAVGGNKFTKEFIDFLFWCYENGYVCNVTVNQRILKEYATSAIIKMLLDSSIIRGLGVSYRKDVKLIDEYFITHPNVVLHTIAGIDTVDEIVKTNFKKVLVLGYKMFGFGKDYHTEAVDKNLQQWYWWVKKLMDAKDVVSFDNLALEQLNIRRFFTQEKWDEFYQGEHSMYINAVDKYFAPSSRSDDTLSWNNILIKEYFKFIEDEK